ncbi:phosphate acetyltransferase/phosphate butyryltransferase [Allopseudospirillum japonicum]|uniref:Phosphate acetyltransferase/phosphate butyryltransferase n=1 Tax=Allopseudospirillum japonicum TaxID=64971 RepID=A0A1H6Q9T5_9GAMM|nr:bifunctional enoyl-CoA hydratase/phosphate acetyltransferase [Allopseudospirillum japonicum]SEI40539.1 phosphate acetyltransferase/phosphate butyryltransferase [Allopseudospirillum japonicum]
MDHVIKQILAPHAPEHEDHHHQQLQYFLQQAKETGKPAPTAVVHPVDTNSLRGAIDAAEEGLIDPVIIGPEHKIRQVAEEADINLANYRICSTEHSHAAAEMAVELARNGEVHALMKGSLGTSELLGAVVNKQKGLLTERRLSHVFVLDVPSYHKSLLVSDAAINIVPDLMVKRDILQNVIDCAHALGVAMPKVAILSAVEKVKANIQSTLDAAALCKMADRGQITGAIVDGPLAFDNAISAEAAQAKHINSPVPGDVDILMVPNLESGNILAKQLQYLAGAKSAGIVMGARVPIILTSRAAKPLERLSSCAVAVLVARKLGRLL